MNPLKKSESPPFDSEKKYLEKLSRLVRYFEKERKERFYPFYLIFKGETEDPRFEEALGIAKYYLENAFPVSSESDKFYRFLKQVGERYGIQNADYWKYAKKTPLPMQDYLKVAYDLRSDEH